MNLQIEQLDHAQFRVTVEGTLENGTEVRIATDLHVNTVLTKNLQEVQAKVLRDAAVRMQEAAARLQAAS